MKRLASHGFVHCWPSRLQLCVCVCVCVCVVLSIGSVLFCFVLCCNWCLFSLSFLFNAQVLLRLPHLRCVLDLPPCPVVTCPPTHVLYHLYRVCGYTACVGNHVCVYTTCVCVCVAFVPRWSGPRGPTSSRNTSRYRSGRVRGRRLS